MNFMACETAQKLRGGYYTPPDVADFLVRWVLQARPRRILEPACGDGAFLAALARHRAELDSVVACEIDANEARVARRHLRRLETANSRIVVDDFLQWHLRADGVPPFDAVLGNPPFIRYQYLDAMLQERAERIFQRFELPFTKHTNAWVPFVIGSLAMLRPGGRLGMVVPAELLHVLHARSLRRFSLEQCSHIRILDPEGLWFAGTLQGVVLLLAEKRSEESNDFGKLAIEPFSDRAALARPVAPSRHWLPAEGLGDKWMLGLLTGDERALWKRLGEHPSIHPFGEVARVDVGIVTGANQFFLVSDDVVAAHGLQAWAHPMFGRSAHVPGVIYDRVIHEANRRAGLPANFLWFDRPLEELDEAARQYIAAGVARGLHRRYKCRIRSPWFTVPSVSAAPVAMLKRAHHFPRLILNSAGAFSTDTAYRIVPTAVRAADLVAGFINSLTALSAELEGRHYGGGVLELVPSEIERVRVPVHRWPRHVLTDLDRAVRTGGKPEELLARQDEVVLTPLGIDRRDQEVLRAACRRLRLRRQRATE